MPLRLEVGPRDFEARQVTVARRDSPPGTKGVGMPVDGLGPKIAELLEQFQADLFATAKKARDEKLVQVWEWKDFVPALNQNCIVLTPFCNEIEWEEQVKTKSRDEYLDGEAEDERTATSVAAKTLCIPFKQVRRARRSRHAPGAAAPPFPPPARARDSGWARLTRTFPRCPSREARPARGHAVLRQRKTRDVLGSVGPVVLAETGPPSRSCAVARVRGLPLVMYHLYRWHITRRADEARGRAVVSVVKIRASEPLRVRLVRTTGRVAKIGPSHLITVGLAREPRPGASLFHHPGVLSPYA